MPADFSTEPVPHNDKESASSAFMSTAENVTRNEQWMGVMFELGPEGQLVVHRTTYKFPKHLLMAACTQLRSMLQQEAEQLDTQPLPTAERFRMRLVDKEPSDAQPAGGE